ncbi:MAG: proprotein convertase P-domain-containing protein [Nitrososphaerales archaeon]
MSSILILSTVTIVPAGKCQLTKVYESSDVPKDILDLDTAESIINVADKGTIEDINVILTIYHTWDDDLNVTLISPTGTKIGLFSDVGGSGDNFTETVLDDEAERNITAGSDPFIGSYRPEESLSGLDGEEMQGNWTLRVYDDSQEDVGTLEAWSIEIKYASPPIWTLWWFWPLIIGVIIVVAIVIIIAVMRRKPAIPTIPPPPPPSS